MPSVQGIPSSIMAAFQRDGQLADSDDTMRSKATSISMSTKIGEAQHTKKVHKTQKKQNEVQRRKKGGIAMESIDRGQIPTQVMAAFVAADTHEEVTDTDDKETKYHSIQEVHTSIAKSRSETTIPTQSSTSDMSTTISVRQSALKRLQDKHMQTHATSDSDSDKVNAHSAPSARASHQHEESQSRSPGASVSSVTEHHGHLQTTDKPQYRYENMVENTLPRGGNLVKNLISYEGELRDEIADIKHILKNGRSFDSSWEQALQKYYGFCSLCGQVDLSCILPLPLCVY